MIFWDCGKQFSMPRRRNHQEKEEIEESPSPSPPVTPISEFKTLKVSKKDKDKFRVGSTSKSTQIPPAKSTKSLQGAWGSGKNLFPSHHPADHPATKSSLPPLELNPTKKGNAVLLSFIRCRAICRI